MKITFILFNITNFFLYIMLGGSTTDNSSAQPSRVSERALINRAAYMKNNPSAVANAISALGYDDSKVQAHLGLGSTTADREVHIDNFKASQIKFKRRKVGHTPSKSSELDHSVSYNARLMH